MSSKPYFAAALSLLLTLSLAVTGAHADAGGPTDPAADPFIVTGNTGLVQAAIDPNSSNGISPDATYNGQVTSQESWMPVNAYGGNIPATYDVYTQIGANGQAQVIMIPNQVTAAAAQQHPVDAGVTNASAVMTNAYGAALTPGSEYAQFLSQQIAAQIGSTTSPAAQGYVCGSSACVQTATTSQQTSLLLLNGNGNQQLNLTPQQAAALVQNFGVGWTPSGLAATATGWVCGSTACVPGNNLSAIAQQYGPLGMTGMLMIYTQGNCAFAGPGVCDILKAAQAQAAAAAAAAAGLPDPSLPTSAPECHAPVVKVGQISASATKIAPNFPLVIGQDETLRGADVTYSVTVEPTSYTTWSAVAQYTNVRECNEKTGKCTTTKVFTGWKCVSSVTWYPESVTSAHAGASLSQKSREWIESGDLQIHYPGAYLHHPDFGLGGGGGSFHGDTYEWSLAGNLQVADPGEFNLEVSGRTSGTPVHAGRSFSGGGTFLVYLREVVIIK